MFAKGSGKESILNNFSWYIMKREIAKAGVFNKQGLTPLESVNKENLHNILFYLNLQALENKENEQKS